MRRDLRFETLEASVAECRQLLRTGYIKNGQWTLGQICRHMRLTIEANMEGYPSWMTALGYPLRPFLRKFMLPRLLTGNSPSGVKTASRFVPPADLDDAAEVEAFAECVKRFQSNPDPLHAHPGFGRMSREEFENFHAVHTAHHLSFLAPR